MTNPIAKPKNVRAEYTSKERNAIRLFFDLPAENDLLFIEVSDTGTREDHESVRSPDARYWYAAVASVSPVTISAYEVNGKQRLVDGDKRMAVSVRTLRKVQDGGDKTSDEVEILMDEKEQPAKECDCVTSEALMLDLRSAADTLNGEADRMEQGVAELRDKAIGLNELADQVEESLDDEGGEETV